MKRPIINFNQEWMEATPEMLHALTPGVIRGRGIFETILVEQGRVCWWEEHLRRLQQGAGLYKIKIPFSSKKMLLMIKKTVHLNKLASGRLRISLYTDQGQAFFNIVAVPYNGGTQRDNSLKTMVSSLRRKKNKYSRAKSLEYHPFYEARQEAKAKGFDEALLLDPAGYLVEGSTANIFFVGQGALCTPSVECGCLNGIVRQQVVRLAKEAGIPVKTGWFKLNRLLKADEAFLTNSLIGLKPAQLSGAKQAGRKKSPVTDLLKALYARYPKYS
jgi:branched-subunit amino acid aminotransferase/4-amino-4-deoxychorismate lyase